MWRIVQWDELFDLPLFPFVPSFLRDKEWLHWQVMLGIGMACFAICFLTHLTSGSTFQCRAGVPVGPWPCGKFGAKSLQGKTCSSTGLPMIVWMSPSNSWVQMRRPTPKDWDVACHNKAQSPSAPSIIKLVFLFPFFYSSYPTCFRIQTGKSGVTHWPSLNRNSLIRV